MEMRIPYGAGTTPKANRLTSQVGAHAHGAGRKCWTYGGDHVQDNCPENPPEEQPHGNRLHLEPEITVTKWWKEYHVPIVTNVISGPQVPRSTSPPLIFLDQSHWGTHEGPIPPLLLLSLLIRLLGLLPNLEQPTIPLEVSI